MAYGALCLTWFIIGVRYNGVPGWLIIVTALAAAASACYSAFLFAQAKGRDLWQSPLFLGHLLVHALVAGTSVFLLATICGQSLMSDHAPRFESMRNFYMMGRAFLLLLLLLLVSLCMILAEVFWLHATEGARLATRNLVRGRLSFRFWILVICAGVVLPVVLLLLASRFPLRPFMTLVTAAALLALAGVWWFEDIWVKAGQSVPLS
jgi:Ni/Fe-hydrogenase subunit HybB-like protein